MSAPRRRRRPGCWTVEPADGTCTRSAFARRAEAGVPVPDRSRGALVLAAQLGASPSWDVGEEAAPSTWDWDLAGWDAGAAGARQTPTRLASDLVSVLEAAAGPAVALRRGLVRRALAAAVAGGSWAIAIAGVGAAAVVGAGLVSGYQPVIVRSASMGRSVPVGSLVLARSVAASSVHPGQVVTVRTPDGTLLTHRVVETRSAGGAAVELHLKGDANATVDPTSLVARRVAVPVLVVPTAGRVAAALGSPLGTASVGAGLVATLAVGWGGRDRRRVARTTVARLA